MLWCILIYMSNAINFLGTYNYSGSKIVHYGIEDGRGNILPACGTRIGRYALPWHNTGEVTCQKCRAL